MTRFWSTYKILMIFLLLWWVLPIKNSQAQYMPVSNTETFSFNDEIPISEQPDNNNYDLSTNEYNIVDGEELAGNITYFQWIETSTSEYMEGKRKEYSVQQNENFIRLYMDGSLNTANATQKGSGNFMNADIYGVSNEGNYLQVGNENFIHDRIGTQQNPQSGVYREINQYGSGLGIENAGNPTTDMIIKQWGQDMKLKITETPIH